MKRPAVFFDRDNTLIANDGYLGDPAQVTLIPGAADAIARARTLGYAIVTVSNQSGVARGMFDEDAVRAVNAKMDELLRAQNPAAIIDRHEFCPYHPQAAVEKYRSESPLRKPKPGMLIAASEAMSIDLPHSWLIGDAPRDIAAGKAAGCRTILFHDSALPPSPAAEADGNTAPDHTAASLSDAVAYIAGQITPTPPTATVATKPAALAMAPPVRNPPAPTFKPETLPAASSRLETVAEQILLQLRRGGEMDRDDFSVSKLLAGLVQIFVLAVLFLGYVQVRNDVAWLQVYVLVALTLQAMTIALLIMSRQK